MYFVEYVLRCCKDKSVLGCDNASLGEQSLTFFSDCLTLKMKAI
jgi:hypothetical protein